MCVNIWTVWNNITNSTEWESFVTDNDDNDNNGYTIVWYWRDWRLTLSQANKWVSYEWVFECVCGVRASVHTAYRGDGFRLWPHQWHRECGVRSLVRL